MSATARARTDGGAPRLAAPYGLDLFGEPPAGPAPTRPATRPAASPLPAPAEPALEPRPAPQPRALRIRRDFAAPRELVWDAVGRGFVARGIAKYNGAPAYHLYRAFELGTEATHRDIVRVRSPSAGVQIFGRVDTRRLPVERVLAEVTPSGVRPSKSPAPPTDLRAPFDWQLQCEAEARALINELCPETVVGPREGLCGVYLQPAGVLLTINPEHRYAAVKAAWINEQQRRTAP